MNNTFTSINYLQWIDLMESFYKFKHEAERITFYPNEIKKMEQSIIELNPNANIKRWELNESICEDGKTKS